MSAAATEPRLDLRRAPAVVLHDVFGHAQFKGQQEEVIRHITEGGDAVGLFPTGGGKPVCYQIPAICRGGDGIRVSPVVALMRDQVEVVLQAGPCGWWPTTTHPRRRR